MKTREEVNQTYYSKNREKIKAYARQQRQENPEHIKEIQRRSYRKHRERVVARVIAYQKRNPERYQQWRRKWEEDHLLERNAAKREIRNRNMDRLKILFGGACCKCGSVNDLHFHHVDRDDKEFVISQHADRSFRRLLAEARKCILLCAECHKTIHGNGGWYGS